MATYLENLTTRRDNIAAELANIDSSGSTASTKAGGVPDHSGSGVAHTAYRLSLMAELKSLKEEIISAQGPVEVSSETVL